MQDWKDNIEYILWENSMRCLATPLSVTITFKHPPMSLCMEEAHINKCIQWYTSLARVSFHSLSWCKGFERGLPIANVWIGWEYGWIGVGVVLLSESNSCALKVGQFWETHACELLHALYTKHIWVNELRFWFFGSKPL